MRTCIITGTYRRSGSSPEYYVDLSRMLSFRHYHVLRYSRRVERTEVRMLFRVLCPKTFAECYISGIVMCLGVSVKRKVLKKICRCHVFTRIYKEECIEIRMLPWVLHRLFLNVQFLPMLRVQVYLSGVTYRSTNAPLSSTSIFSEC